MVHNSGSDHAEVRHAGQRVWINYDDIKAIYKVRDFEGKYSKEEVYKEYVPEGSDITVFFDDGEVLNGYIVGHYDNTVPRFWVIPRATMSNNISVLVERSSIKKVELGKTQKRFQLAVLCDNAIKRKILAYYWKNSTTSTTYNVLASVAECSVNEVRDNLEPYFDMGLIKEVKSANAVTLEFTPPADHATREFMSKMYKEIKRFYLKTK